MIMAVALSTVFVCAARAQVNIEGTGSSVTASPGGAASFTYVLTNPGVSNVLVVGFYNDNATVPVGVTFDANPADGYAENDRTVAAYYFTPDESVDINITVNTAATSTGFFVYELSGIDDEGAVDLGTGSAITTTGDTKFVLNFSGINFGNGGGTIPAVGSVISNADVLDINGGGGGGALAHGYGYAGLAGAQTLGWSYNNGAPSGQVSLAFETGVNPDSDGDGLLDVWENANFGSLTAARGTEAQDLSLGADWDNDGDGIDNESEETGGSDPNDSDSVPGDTDGDGWADADELAYFANLLQDPDADFDGDFSSNRDEADAGVSPADAGAWPDSDNDNMADGWETTNGLVVGSDDSGLDADSDDSTNLEEFQAGSDPQDSNWTPDHAVLAHRWSFTNDLQDSVGGSHAQVVNDDAPSTGASSLQNPTSFTLFGGAKATSDYLLLGSNLLSGTQADGVKPMTIELWASQDVVMNWSRIFNFGTDDGSNPGNNESLRMTWSQGTDLNADQVAWEGQATAWGPGNAPYVEAVDYHIVMTIVPAVHSGGAITQGCTVTWYSAPAASSQPEGHPIYGAKGTFNTVSDLRNLLDSACTLGRSYYPDATAAATYDEVRVWYGALTEAERELFQLLGPDNIDRSDVDDDGFPDQWEIARFGDLMTAAVGIDTDADTFNDDVELAEETDPNDVLATPLDSDKDDLDDLWEMQFFNNLLQLGDDDPDGDFTDNEVEETFGTDPTDPDDSPDTDGDGMADGWEQYWFFDLTTADSTLREGGVDTNFDGDFDTDLEEFLGGFDPEDEFSGRDTEPDGLPDYWEFFYFGDDFPTNYLTVVVAAQDLDGDGADNIEEFDDGTNPNDGADFIDDNGDGVYDGVVLSATDGFGQTSFNAGTNWSDGQAPVPGRNYLVPSGLRLRTPNTADATLAFAGAKLVVAGELALKGDNSTFSADYLFSDEFATPRIYQIVDAGGTVSLGGSVEFMTASEIDTQNGPVAFAASVSGDGALSLVGLSAVQFDNLTNSYAGDITMSPTTSLVVNGDLSVGSGSVFSLAPGAAGESNSIGGTGTLGLAGSLDIDLGQAIPAVGATWDLLTTATVNFDPGFIVTGSGFTPDGGAVGDRIWTDSSGSYEFSEATGVLSFVGTVVGFDAWKAAAGLTPGEDDGEEDNPDFDDLANVLEYQLNGNPLGFESDLVQTTEDETHLVLTFERYDLSESDTTLTLQWGTVLESWNDVVIGAASATDADGVEVIVEEDLGASGADYDAVTVRVPKSLAQNGKLFVRLKGTLP